MCKSIVFIGDSITDAGRTYPTVSTYGYGYAGKAIAHLMQQEKDVVCYNRGVAGDVVKQVYNRFDEDCLALSPSVVTLFVGINDVDFSYRRENFPFDEKALFCMLQDMMQRVTKLGAKLILIQPYAFDGELYKDAYKPRLDVMQKMYDTLAEKYASQYIVPNITKDMTVEGVHPTEDGHNALMQQWLKAYCAL